MEMYNLENPATLEALGLSKCWEAYANNAAGQDIMSIGFNDQTGYVYIALENGITIASAFGRSVEFIIFNDEDQEFFLDDYETASNFAY
jgi:hypothetical protein